MPITATMNVREGIKKFSEKGNEALLKELNQLHEQQVILPIKRRHVSKEKRALWYLVFLKENMMAASMQDDVQTASHKVNTQQNQTPALQQCH